MTALRRYLVLQQETETAWCPDWYAHIQAAKYLGIDPERLLELPLWWKQKAFIAMTAENEARRILDNHNK